MSNEKDETEEILEFILFATAGILFVLPWLHYEQCKKNSDEGLHSSPFYSFKVSAFFLTAATLWSALAFLTPWLQYRFPIPNSSFQFPLWLLNVWGIGNILGIPIVSLGFHFSGKFKNNRSNLRTGLY